MKKNKDKYANIDDPETTSLEIAITGIKIQDMAAKRFVSASSLVSLPNLLLINYVIFPE